MTSTGALKFLGQCRNYVNHFNVGKKKYFPPTHSSPHRRSVLNTYPTDSSSSVFSVIRSKDFEEDVGVGAIVCELQETCQATDTKLGKQGQNFLCWFT